jgi:Uma2 family endonuclease
VNAQFARHSEAKTRLAIAMERSLSATGSSLRMLIESAVQLDDRNLLEPDIFLTTYRGDHVVPGETVVLVVEVSDTTLQHDLVRKSALYAAAGIPEYWVLDTVGRVLHQLWLPGAAGYGNRRESALGAKIGAVTLTDLEVDTRQV